MNAKDAVAERIRDICRTRSLTYNELASLSSLTPSTVYSVLDNSRRDISISTLTKICRGLDMTLKDFFDAHIFENIE